MSTDLVLVRHPDADHPRAAAAADAIQAWACANAIDPGRVNPERGYLVDLAAHRIGYFAPSPRSDTRWTDWQPYLVDLLAAPEGDALLGSSRPSPPEPVGRVRFHSAFDEPGAAMLGQWIYSNDIDPTQVNGVRGVVCDFDAQRITWWNGWPRPLLEDPILTPPAAETELTAPLKVRPRWEVWHAGGAEWLPPVRPAAAPAWHAVNPRLRDALATSYDAAAVLCHARGHRMPACDPLVVQRPCRECLLGETVQAIADTGGPIIYGPRA